MLNPVLDQERAEYLRTRRGQSIRSVLVPAWPRPDKELPQVSLEVTWVRFSTLNHRTRSEQMRISEQRHQPDLFSADPTGPEAQAAQYAILSAQEGFDDLKEDLRQRGQQQPTIVTAEGILINGNRRAAALRSLFVEDDHSPSRYITCLILPEDANHAELVDLETELQIAREFREDYTWVNEALLIEEIFDREGKNWKRVAARMHREVSSVRDQYEKLQQLHQLISLSNGTRHHADFVANESAFTELTKHIRGRPADEAAAVRGAYFLGTLTGVNYRTLRDLRRPDAETLVWKEIENDPTLTSLFEPSTSRPSDGPDILDEVLGHQGGPEGANLNSVLSYFAERAATTEVDVGGATVALDDLRRSVKTAIDLAAEEARDQARDEDTVHAPIKHLQQAIKNIKKALEVLPKARVLDNWEEPKYLEQIAILEQTLPSLGSKE